jgi:phenylacetate-coenzyme A ligase PaaK-like adenylate-forming protein
METADKIKRELEYYTRKSADEVRSMQNARLAQIVKYHYQSERNSTYREFLQAAGIQSEADLPRSVEELRKLPKVNRALLERGRYAERPSVEPSLLQKIIETSDLGRLGHHCKLLFYRTLGTGSKGCLDKPRSHARVSGTCG